MPRKKVHDNQLDFGRHLRATERVLSADELEALIAEREEALRLCRLEQENEVELPQKGQAHYEELERLVDEEIALMGEIQRLEAMRRKLNFAGHSRFRTPAVEGYGLANAIRRQQRRKK